MKKTILALAIVLLLPALSYADSSVGCGLGSLIWKKNSMLSAAFRITTNQILLTQYFGTTTGTSGCSQHSIVMAKMAPVYYAEANLENLKVDMASGEGEYLSAFSTTLGCDPNAVKDVNTLTRDNYTKIFDRDNINPYEMLKNVKKVINSNVKTKGRCKYALI